MKKTIILLSIILTAIALVGCSKEYIPALEYFTVSFDVMGGNPMPDSQHSQSVRWGGLVVEPSNPTKNNYRFIGWYHEGERFNFATIVRQHMILEAHWQSSHVLQTTALWGTAYDNGILWRVIYIDENGRRLIMTEHVFGGGTQFNVTNVFSFLTAPDNNLRQVLNGWWTNVSPLLQERVLPVIGLDRDVRTEPGGGLLGEISAEIGPAGRTQPGTGIATAESLFILSITEVNIFFQAAPDGGNTSHNRRASTVGGVHTRYWLRSPGTNNAATNTIIADNGSFSTERANTPTQVVGFRPVLWLN